MILESKMTKVRLALSHSILREGSKAIRDIEVAAEVGAHASSLDKAKLAEQARSPEIEKRIRQSTVEWQELKASQRPTFLIDTEIGDRANLLGCDKIGTDRCHFGFDD